MKGNSGLKYKDPPFLSNVITGYAFNFARCKKMTVLYVTSVTMSLGY